MPSYRLYKLGPDGRIAVGEWLEAADLREAQVKARAMCAGQPFDCELWLGAERLDAFSCGAASPADGEAEAP
ncbi:hypothetical protein LRS10_01075 [Phenylobacterium sp. J426]|uniref:hypothetical protein n=1 Tax=Phenylobacterium sp. J426 TaxID=2898439 RepID=UPI00215126AC|nr:hypothetical protein [Phenylobacterium sp. J426]MCR5872910.1 hypothetical protein [Phenylobacterium sp. J426]